MLKEKYHQFQILHHLQKRINKLVIKIKDITKDKEFKDEYIVIAIDSTGIKITNTGSGCKTNGI